MGTKKKLEAAIEYFLAVLSQQPNNHLTRVFLGGCYSLKGQRPKHVFNNLYWGTKGLNLMDNAVKAAPDNYRVRLERAINSLHLNSHFYRDPIAGKDLRVLLSRTDFSGISNQLKQLTWLYAGLYFKRESKLDKSLQMWHNVIELDPKSNISRKAQKLLQKYKE